MSLNLVKLSTTKADTLKGNGSLEAFAGKTKQFFVTPVDKRDSTLIPIILSRIRPGF